MVETCLESCFCRSAGASQAELAGFLEYLAAWDFGDIVDNGPGETLSRAQVNEQMFRKARSDARFREEMQANPRLVYAIALSDGTGISKVGFLSQIREVRILEEPAGVLYLVLPVRGRAWVGDAPEADSEPADGAAETRPPAASSAEIPGRAEVEEAIRRRAARDAAFKQQLLFRPIATYQAAARDLCSGQLPGYLAGTKDIRVVAEANDTVYLPFLRV